VVFGVLLRSMLVVIRCMQGMPVRYLGMARGFLVVAGLGMFCGFAMVLRRMIVVVRRQLMMIVDVVAFHCHLPVYGFIEGLEHHRDG
jgi:hypothetical protein